MAEQRHNQPPTDPESPAGENFEMLCGDMPRTHTLSPHFLFNALNTVEALSREAAARIPEVVRGLSVYLRYVLSSRRDGMTTVREELDAVASYLRVEKARFEDRLDVEFQVVEPAPSQRMPEFLLLSLVEHAIDGGMASGPVPLRVVVNAQCVGGRLCVEVSSTGAGAAVATDDVPFLQRLQRRLERSYEGGDFRLTSSESRNSAAVTIEIAVHKQAGP